MFFARVRKDDGSLNGVEIQTLKNKLGTRQLPTGELLLDGTDAYRVRYNSFYKYGWIVRFTDSNIQNLDV